MSLWQKIYNHLKSRGIDVYSPGQHQGECTSPYTVVKTAGSNQLLDYSSTQPLYDVMCYVPEEFYSRLEPYVETVKGFMKELYPMIVPMEFETASFLDDTVKGHMISIQYRASRKITRR